MTAAAVDYLPSGQLLSVELNRAASALGCGIGQLQYLFVDWTGGEAWQNFNTGSGTSLYGAAAGKEGIVVASSGATASSQGWVSMIATGSSGNAQFMPGGTSGEWYMSSRFAIVTVPNAQARLSGFGSSDEFITVGCDGAQSIAFFNCAFTNGAIVSTKALDTSQHVHRVVRKSGSSLYTIDDANGVSGNMYGNTPHGPSVYAQNRLTAANQSIESDWLFSAFKRT
jgi:hypothetical protein